MYHVLPSSGLSFYLLAIIGSVQRSTSQRTQTATLSRTKESNIINLQHILLYQWTKRWKTSMCLKQENGSPTLFGHLRQTSSKTRNIKKSLNLFEIKIHCSSKTLLSLYGKAKKSNRWIVRKPYRYTQECKRAQNFWVNYFCKCPMFFWVTICQV